eukprot:SAG31_NODE_2356_length_5874_cov_17.280000_2_plen_108_part_00
MAKVGSIEWLSSHVDELLRELRRLDVFVPDLEDEPGNDLSAGGKGSAEKRRLRGNTKSAKKSMKAMHKQMLERRSSQLEKLVEKAQLEQGRSHGAGHHRGRSARKSS